MKVYPIYLYLYIFSDSEDIGYYKIQLVKHVLLIDTPILIFLNIYYTYIFFSIMNTPTKYTLTPKL